MKRIILLAFIISSIPSLVDGQAKCGFEDGSTTGWILSNGTIANSGTAVIYTAEVTGTIENEHLITKKTDGNDPKIYSESIPMAAPGSNYSIRFGNTTRGSKFDRLTKSFRVNQENTLFQYQFAVILQDDFGKHASYEKPGFNVRIFDSNGNDISCSFYDVQLQATSTVEGFKVQGDLEYRNWTTVAIDLRNYVGQTVTVEATVHGCTKKVHYGYGYFNAYCLKSEVKPETPCPDSNGDITLKAPEGFEKYIWSTGETEREIKVKATMGNQFSVKLFPFNSLNENCNLHLDFFVPRPEIPVLIDKAICVGENFVFKGTTYNTAGTYTQIISNSSSCDSVITLNLRVIPIAQITKNVNICEGNSYNFKGNTYNSTGTFYKTVSSVDACDSIYTINLKVVPIPRISNNFSICEGEKVRIGDSTYKKSGTYITTIKRLNLCDSVVTTTIQIENTFKVTSAPDVILEKGDSTLITASVQPTGNYIFNWTPQETLSCTSCINTWAKPPITTTYIVSVSAINSKCIKQAETKVIISCGIYVPTAFSPNNDQMNDIFYIVGSKCVSLIKEMNIYDRWGELVFRDENFPTADTSHGWDGSYKGKNLMSDVFTYKIVAEMKNGEISYHSGAITLLR
ncbi:MAG: T9SS type B sorting domain-containing protein [Bacteroidota bacterium]